MYVSAVLAVIVGVLVWIFYRQRKQKYSFFKDRGIPGPQPNILFANAVQLQELGPSQTVRKWTQKYGSTYGYYESANTPVLVTSDLDVIQQVFVKEFSKFSARKLFAIGDDPSKPENISMFLAEGFRWKRLRSIVSPAFSTNKMKKMTPLVQDCIGTMMESLDAKNKQGKTFDILQIFQGLTLDVIASVAFGIQVQSQSNPSDPFLVACRHVFSRLQPDKMPFAVKAMLTSAVALPEFKSFLRVLFAPVKNAWMTGFLKKKCMEIIKDRKQNPTGRPDFLTIMLAAETENIDFENERSVYRNEAITEEKTTNTSVLSGGKMFAKRLTINEIKSNSELFLIAGYETTSNALGYAAYELALNPDKQEKLQENIDEFTPDGEAPNYTNIQKMQYLDMVLNEVLRLHPIAPSVTSRRCLKDVMINGILVKEGVSILPDVLTIHNDPEVWGPTDPSLFDPERFSPEAQENRHPMAFLSFGAGPRNCIGMRFALLEAKLALANVMKKYTIVKTDEMEVPLMTSEGGTITPAHGVKVMIQARNEN
ncbi:cytochrome P450 3A4-like [Tubulanus polymorphus]|uniref:cytochrome P450 3A4-like n=1 Tax=Tubulanus polymorphus TaxID=672921 RepID=UPI003DA68DD5